MELPLTILNAEWFFRLSPIRRYYQYPEMWAFILAGLLVSWLIASLAVHNYDLKKIRKELEALTVKDILTGTLNRRGLFRELGALVVRPGAEFILCYVDLNRFKSVNDTYGHLAGDRVLEHFASVVCGCPGDDRIFARIGGDEFIVVFKDTNDREKAAAFFESLAEKLRAPFYIGDSRELPGISFSMGMALYPSQARDIDTLIICADKAMYRDKSQK